jgi:hypothetical protein
LLGALAVPLLPTSALSQPPEKVWRAGLLRDQFSDPDTFAAYVEEHQKERRRRSAEAQKEEAGLKRKLANCEA